MENNSTLQELNETKSLYTKYVLNSKIVPILFSAANVNIFVYVFWTIIYYTLYYGYTVNKINKNMDTFQKNLEENVSFFPFEKHMNRPHLQINYNVDEQLEMVLFGET